MSYVELKHGLSAVALQVVAHPEHAGLADALLAYARGARNSPRVPLAALARAAGMPDAAVARALADTGLFDPPAPDGAVALRPPFRTLLAYLRRQSARTAVAARLLRASHREGIPPEIWRGAALFNAGLFFECHEFWEDVWRETAGPDRAFYHGLVQAAAGCYHYEKGNIHGARTLIGKAAAKLGPYGPRHREVEVSAFVLGLHGVLSRLEEADRSARGLRRASLPALDLVDSPRARRRRARACSVPSVPRPGGRS